VIDQWSFGGSTTSRFQSVSSRHTPAKEAETVGKKIVIIGGVAAGPKAAARARRLDPSAEITIVEKDEILSYAGCGLPYYISGMVQDRRQLMATPIGVLRDPQFFAKVKNIRVLNKTMATSIDRKAKEVEVQSVDTGETQRLPYDKLVIATGAEPVEPPIPGKDLKNVLRLKRLEDADLFREHLQGACPRVVIVGGGLIGMEMTEAVSECGSSVTIVEMLPHLLPMIDRDMALLAEKHMRQRGVQVVTSARVERFEGDEDGYVKRVVTTNGNFEAPLALLSIGLRPNVELARNAGLIIGASGGIYVNEYMQTSDPNIYAAGDCAEKSCFVRGTTCFLPLGSVANKEGRVAGSNAVGHVERFPGVAGATALKVFEMNVARAGLSVEQAAQLGIPVVSATAAAPDKPHYYPGAKPIVLKLIAEKATRRLIGIQGIGLGEVIKRVDVAVTAMTAGMTVDAVAGLDLTYAPPYSEAMDVLINGANILRNKLDGLVKGCTATELQASREAGEDMMLLDVRSPDEHQAGTIPGSTLIPLGAVRSRLAEIPRDKRVVAYCKSSLRAWEASRILAGEGFDNVEILDGGFLAWPFETQ
jgi:NADPH-dependent 2,4-dienoyl-CoA reductase/sulfur reductase-like enzyme/rhodanese-related sulfurtransferase